MNARTGFVAESTWSSSDLAERTLHRRAVEAVIWGIPLINYDAVYQAMVRDAKGGFNQIAYWSHPSDWRNQTITPNGETLNVFIYVNTKQTGPTVIEIPPVGDAIVSGSVIDCWQTPLEDVGPAGADQGKGGKYLLLPPGCKDTVPSGYIPVPAETSQTYTSLQTIPRSWSKNDLARSVAYLTQVKVYPLSQAAMPPPTKFIDVADTVYDGTISYDLRCFESLDRMVQAEPFQARDTMMIGWLRSIGIEKGKPFKPNAKTTDILTSAAKEAKAWLDNRFLSVLQPYYRNKQWLQPFEALSNEMHSIVEPSDLNATDARGLELFFGYGAPRRTDGGHFSLLAQRDSVKEWFRGDNTYRLTVPPKVPAAQLWSVIVYDLATAAVIRESPRISLSSLVESLRRNADNSVDIYFGPKPPAGHEVNWVMTKPDGRFFVAFRFYGPEKPMFDKTWQLPDLERVR